MDYSVIPSFACREGCSDCCGPVPWSRQEWETITAWLKARGRQELKATSLTCPYVGPGSPVLLDGLNGMLAELQAAVEVLQPTQG